MELTLDQDAARDEAITFTAFFEAEYDRLYRTFVLMTGDRGEADEVAQEAMARVYERWHRVRKMASPAGYTYSVAFNLNRRRLRSQLRWRARVAGGSVADPTTDDVETRRDVRAAVLRLPAPLREAIVLAEWLEMSADEAGRVLGIEPVSVRGRLHRARKMLREMLGEPDE